MELGYKMICLSKFIIFINHGVIFQIFTRKSRPADTLSRLANRYKNNLYKMTSFQSVIFTARFVIFYVIQVVDGITPTLTLDPLPKLWTFFAFISKNNSLNGQKGNGIFFSFLDNNVFDLTYFIQGHLLGSCYCSLCC